MTYVEKIINISTGEETLRNFTAKEVKEIEAAIAKADAEMQSEAAAEAAKTAAKQVVLDKLGLSAEEMAALLG
jgi:hypothetical protein